MTNHLKGQSSPYLLQHSENPVDWYPWGKEAFTRAERENKPVFVSIGYSTCHWCHVMAEESFENEAVAAILNRYFISVKVDREERPDIDSVYMTFCQAFTGRGGWPMSIFMTAEQKPFFAGTYFPPETRYGMIGFRDLLLTVADKWQNSRSDLLETADQIVAAVHMGDNTSEQEINERLPEQAAVIFSQTFDAKNGGFGQAPKFPTPHNLIFLLLYARIHKDQTVAEQVYITLEKMRRGGIFDQIGFGFSRYSTDEFYLVPHFEKMLYDNALLILSYAAAYQSSGRKEFLDTACQTAEYLLREMRGAEGAFYSAQDADSEGQEGKYYVWTQQEIYDVLGKEAGQAFCQYYDITSQGNFEGKNIPNLLNGKDLSNPFTLEIEKLYLYRKSRAKLHLDDKVLTAWNSLAVMALSVLYRVTGNTVYMDAALSARDYIEQNLMEGDILYVSCREGVRSVRGFLEDYAYYAASCLVLYGVTGSREDLDKACRMTKAAMEQFMDPQSGGFYLYGTQNDSLVSRPKETQDGALPSGNSVMAYCLVRLSQLTEQKEYRLAAERQLAFLSAKARDYPIGHTVFLTALLYYRNPPSKVVAVLSPQEHADDVRRRLPLYSDLTILPEETAEYVLLDDRTTYYVCRDHMCFPPTHEVPVI